MIVSKTAITKWNSKKKKYYQSLGYSYTKMGDEFEVLVEHLPDNSSSEIAVKCDYCSEHYNTTLLKRTKAMRQNPTTLKDSCKNCIKEKIKESNNLLYGVEYAIASNKVRDRINSTFLNKYGVTNPFQLEDVKRTIKQTNLEKYGNESFVRTENYKVKTKETNLEKYGVEVASKSEIVRSKLKGKTSGEKHYNWKGGISKENTVLRQTSDYKNWRKSVFERDYYTCQCCNLKGGKLNAHHIENFSSNESTRFDIENGITLCQDCHNNFHQTYGKKDNNMVQLKHFIKING